MTVLSETYMLNNDVEIPKIGFGTWQIPDGDLAYDSVRMAIDAGYRHIDTAYVYGNECSVGRAISDSRVSRDEIFVTSKLPAEVKRADEVQKYFDKTMEHLGLEVLDLYLIHAPWPWNHAGHVRMDDENLAVWGQMEEIYRSGRVRAIGVSNFDDHDLKNILDHGEIVPAVNQMQYYIGATEPRNRIFAQSHGVLVEAYSPLATGGLLKAHDLEVMAEKYNVSTAQLAIRFCIQNGVLPLPKATSQAHIKANAEVDFVIDDADMDLLRAFTDPNPDGHNPSQR